ncbi:glycine cleavage system aminomethyltransferase GcvT [Microbacterium luticocti]|uniref:glycine cleavage system aminomethyltransferase GcvT n=1 Tax=Microbacterium luticocti TaxID=451764 RepID=UPI00041151B2|nr:glycine cleavage system aminomethyltransferase GcvT [Microbacterium luticocti]
MSELRQTPLHERHEALGATFTDFGGWSMPVRYTSDLTEHKAVREAAGLFDISHMAEFRVTGPQSGALLDFALAGRLSALAVGKAKYSLVLAEDGGIIDDVIVYRLGDESFLVIANAGNRDAVAAAFTERGRDGAEVEDVTDQYALIAVQGPHAERILGATAGLAAADLPGLGYYAWRDGTFEGAPVLIARTGYTGEDGFELLVPNEKAGALWDALLAAGTPDGLIPAGLAARDTLRLEAGMPLYGHELRRDIVPAQAGLGRVVVTAKDDFVGKAGLAARDVTDAPVLVGLVAEGRRAGRAGYAVLDADGTAIGTITSGALSPTLGHPIAMAFVPPALSETGTVLAIDVRGTGIPATVTDLPFYRRKK